jgi:Putative beta-barrel porin-2, OmpL-like. bbp2
MRNRILMLLAGCAGAALAHGAWAEDQADPAATTSSAPALAPAAAAPATITLAQAASPPPPPATGAAAAPAAPALTGPAAWFSTFSVRGQIDVGSTINPWGPDNGVNFGHLFTDKANKILLNQGAVTFERDIDPKATGWDLGVKAQFFYGTDARYTHYIGELDRVTGALDQVDIVEANATIHMPVLTKGGIDVKIGQYVTPLGEEVIDPSGNFFYSHSYLFNFGIPLKHTGILTITHVNPMIDIYAGYDTGVNTSVGTGGGFNDARFHFIAGFGLNFAKVTVLALTHIGPELPEGALGPGINVGSYLRFENDILVTWKITDKLTSISEGNYISDQGVQATGGGFVQYFTYVLTPEITAGIRAEAWRDNNGFWVAAFPGNLDFINAETGMPNTSYGGGDTTYGGLTAGINIKPSGLPKIIAGTNIRPEIRWDTVLAGGTKPYNGNPGTASSQLTFGIDLVIPIH